MTSSRSEGRIQAACVYSAGFLASFPVKRDALISAALICRRGIMRQGRVQRLLPACNSNIRSMLYKLAATAALGWCIQLQDDYGVSEIEAEMAASMQQQQAKRRAAASKRASSNKRQKQVRMPTRRVGACLVAGRRVFARGCAIPVWSASMLCHTCMVCKHVVPYLYGMQACQQDEWCLRESKGYQHVSIGRPMEVRRRMSRALLL
eukprot:890270-Pelagomonas_calceolata.AAC.2